MEEIRKVKRVLGKALPGAPHEVLLVLDANTGQNALAQVKAFDEALGLTGPGADQAGRHRQGGRGLRDRQAAAGAAALRRGRRGHRRPAALRRPREFARRCLISFSAVAKRYPGGEEALRGISFSLAGGRVRLRHRAFGRGQIDAAQAHPRDRAPDLGQRDRQRPERGRAQALGGALPAAQPRTGVPGPEAALRPHGLRQRHAAARHRRAAAARGGEARARGARQGGAARARARQPDPALRAASSSAWRSRARSSTGPPCSSPTSLPPTSTRNPPGASSTSSSPSTRSASRCSSRRTTRRLIERYGKRVLRLVAGRLEGG